MNKFNLFQGLKEGHSLHRELKISSKGQERCESFRIMMTMHRV